MFCTNRSGISTFLSTALLIVAASWPVTSASADPLVSGTVSFDSATNIYTYDYSLGNAGAVGITEFSIQVNSFRYSDFYPLSYSSPSGWEFRVGALAGGSCVEGGECGGFWTWVPSNFGSVVLPPGQTLGGFSFQTAVAPSTSAGNNYLVIQPSYTESGVLFGNVVAPDYLLPPPPPPAAPEPAATLLSLIGLGCLTVLVRRRIAKKSRLTA